MLSRWARLTTWCTDCGQAWSEQIFRQEQKYSFWLLFLYLFDCSLLALWAVGLGRSRSLHWSLLHREADGGFLLCTRQGSFITCFQIDEHAHENLVQRETFGLAFCWWNFAMKTYESTHRSKYPREDLDILWHPSAHWDLHHSKCYLKIRVALYW